jgi:hypothetical protein
MKNRTKEGVVRRSRKGKLFFGAVLLALMGLFLASCKNDFYSTTWGDAFVRDPSNVKVNASNVNELLRDANGDIGASRAILKKLKGTTDPTLKAAAIKAANQSAGLTELVLSNLGTLTENDGNNQEALIDVADKIFGDAKKNDITEVSDEIAEILIQEVTGKGSAPVFKEGSAVKSVSTSDLTLLLVTMMMGEAVEASEDFEDYADRWGKTKNINDSKNLNNNERIIADVANEVIGRPDSELGKMLKNLVGA